MEGRQEVKLRLKVCFLMFFGYEANLTSIIQKANMELEIWQMYVFVLVTFQRGDFQVPAASFQGGIF